MGFEEMSINSSLCRMINANAVNTVNQSSEAIDPAIRDVKHTLQHIMSFLDLQSLGRCCIVSKTWKRAVDDAPELWQSIIYRELAFGNDKWAHCFGPDVIKDEPFGEDFASLPWSEVIADFRNIKKVFPGRKATDCLMLVRLPKTLNGGLSINCLGALAKLYFRQNDDGYKSIAEFRGLHANRSIEKSYWVLMTKDVLPGSRNQSFIKQQQIVANLANQSLRGYRVPGALEAITCIFSQYFGSKIRLFSDKPETYTRCLDRTFTHRFLDRTFSDRLAVGGFAPAGLNVEDGFNDTDTSEYVAVAALRKFS
jgi:hypothetical protein